MHVRVGYTQHNGSQANIRPSRRLDKLPAHALPAAWSTAALPSMHYSPASATFLPTISQYVYAHQLTLTRREARSTARIKTLTWNKIYCKRNESL